MDLKRQTNLRSDKIISMAKLMGIDLDKLLPNVIITTPPINLITDKSNYTIESLSVERWEELWRHDEFNYIPKNPLNAMGKHEWQDQYDRLFESHSRLNNWRRHIFSSNEIPAIVFTINNPQSHKSLVISDGRHRFSLIRELGIERFYAAIPSEAMNVVQSLGLLK